MEKLFIHYKDGGRLIITCQKSGVALRKWELEYASMQDRFKDAYIQRYPKHKNEPIILV